MLQEEKTEVGGEWLSQVSGTDWSPSGLGDSSSGHSGKSKENKTW